MALRCSFCSHERAAPRIHTLASGQKICDYCLEWHQDAMDVLGGGVPRGCQECGATWDFLRDSTLGAEVKMYVVPKDGLYQLLCGACVRKYTAQRADLYRGTDYGSRTLKLA